MPLIGMARTRTGSLNASVSLSERVLKIVVAGGVRNEIQNPRTPSHKKAAILPQIFNLRPGLTESQHAQRRRVRIILQGNARPNKHAADASHLCEAAETGCSYFITHDRRILRGD